MLYPVEIAEEEYEKFRKLIKEKIGVNLTSHKKIMLYGRLLKRMRKLKIMTFEGYYQVVIKSNEELVKMFDIVTTHKTDFFREEQHFQFLSEKLPEIIKKKLKNGEKKISIWSSACSTGEEAYSIAMELAKIPILINWKIKVIASDISVKELESTQIGIYSSEKLKKVSDSYKKIYFRKIDEEKYIVKKRLKNIVKVKKINLISEEYPFHGKFEIIFCRNVFIYFDKETRVKIIKNFLKYLKSGGYLILGSSESIDIEITKKYNLIRIQSSIYYYKGKSGGVENESKE